MTASLDEDVVQRVNDLGAHAWSGVAFRHTTTGRDPLSGVGARLNGGRWNPRGVCSTVYLAQPLDTCLREFARLAQANGMDAEVMLRRPRSLHTIEVHGVPVLDLREQAAMAYVGLASEDVADDDWSACQSVGHAAYFLEMGGVVSSSATGSGLVVAVFEGRLTPGQLVPLGTRALDAASYRAGLDESPPTAPPASR